MSKAKAIGTRAETAVRNYLLSRGYTEFEARRNVLTGSEDQGDVWLIEPKRGPIIFEIKGGQMAKTASWEQMLKWYAESQREADNANANFGFLVTQRAGVGYPRAGQWWAVASLADLIALSTGQRPSGDTIVRLTLADLLDLIHG